MSKNYKIPFLGLLIEKNILNKNLNEYLSYNKGLRNYEFVMNEKFVAYGVGANTLRTISVFNINLNDVLFFIDKNKLFQDRKIENKEIKAPSFLKGKKYPVVIFSELYHDEIKEDLTKIGFKGRVINF